MIQIGNSPRFYYEKEQNFSCRFITQTDTMKMIFMTKITSSKNKNNNFFIRFYSKLWKAIKRREIKLIFDWFAKFLVLIIIIKSGQTPVH